MAKLSASEAKARVVSAIASGASVASAVGSVGRAVKTYEGWRREDPEFRAAVDSVREARAAAKSRGVDESASTISFEEFRREYLFSETFDHQRVWIDVLEGRVPTLKPGMAFEEGNPRRVLINTPPHHSKSQIFSIEWPLYLICMNPNVKIILVSKTQKLAQDFLFSIKQRLTHPRWAKLQATFGGQDGFKGKDPWTATAVYVGGHLRESGEKDPTVQVLGVGGQIYGTRADWVILDDIADLGNAHQFESQMKFINREVQSRVGPLGHVMCVGTRVAAVDIYSELRNPDNFVSGKSPWTRVMMPAVLEYAEDPKDWVTLWPRSDRPLVEGSDEEPDEDGMYRAWDGPNLAERRDGVTPTEWSLIYQQQDVSDEATFKQVCVMGSVDRRRKGGPLRAGAWGHPRNGKEGMLTIGSMDPGLGTTFAVVGSVDRASQKRWLENAFQLSKPTPAQIRDLIKRVTDEYGVDEWVIEEQGFQGFLVHDPELKSWLASRGVVIHGHYTGRNKLDPDFGVASVAALFGTARRINEGAGREVHNDDNLIELPDPDSSQGVKALIEELISWVPGKRGKHLRQDGPMALWFWETRARRWLGAGERQGAPTTHINIPFLSRGRARQRASTVPVGLFGRRLVG